VLYITKIGDMHHFVYGPATVLNILSGDKIILALYNSVIAGWYLCYKPVRGIPTQGSLGNEVPQFGPGRSPARWSEGQSVRICERGVPWRARRARVYNGGLRSEPPAGYKGRAPG